MLATIDLTRRQAERVLEQAVRTQARLEIECRAREGSLHGTLIGREAGVLAVALHDLGHNWPLLGLIGSFCDVHTILSGQLYLFSTCIVDAADDTSPQCLSLAPPDIVQVANRRKLDRVAPAEPVVAQLWPAGGEDPLQGQLTNLSSNGVGCRFPRQPAEDSLLIDDTVRLCFQLPGGGEVFDLPACVCFKWPLSGEEQLDVGLEFSAPESKAGAAALERLRAALARNYAGPTQMGGEL